MKKYITNAFIILILIILSFNLIEGRLIDNKNFSLITNIGFFIISIIFIILYITPNKKKK
ncbi:hypothetical protein CD148_04255 [Staphylococcus delphini]|nr:hypothetical protein CD148_04255 [Staphylococcus delphini]